MLFSGQDLGCVAGLPVCRHIDDLGHNVFQNLQDLPCLIAGDDQDPAASGWVICVAIADLQTHPEVLLNLLPHRTLLADDSGGQRVRTKHLHGPDSSESLGAALAALAATPATIIIPHHLVVA